METKKKGKVVVGKTKQLQKIEAALKAHPNHPKLLFTAGMLHLNRGNVGEAVAKLEACVEAEPENASAHNALGLALYELGQVDNAKIHYQAAAQLQPKNVEYLNNLGVVFLQSSMLPEAEATFKKALTIHKKDALLYSNLGVTYMEQGKEEEANKAFSKALKIDPGEIAANYYLGTASKKENDLSVGDLVKIGELVRIYPAAQFRLKDYAHLYSSRVENIADDSVTIAAPLRRGIPIPFHKSAKLLIGIPRKDALYGFHTEVVARRGGKLPVLMLQRQPRTKRIQRRRYVRIGASFPINMRVIQEPNPGELPSTITNKEIHEKNISGGGLLLLVAFPILRHTILLINIELSDGHFETLGKVVRCRETEMEEDLYEIGIRFTNLSEKERDRVIHFVNQRMVELRRKGLVS